MHYDDGCKCTQGLLLGDYLKALITGENLPIDLEAQAQENRCCGSIRTRRAGAGGLPPGSNFKDGFEKMSAGQGPTAASTAASNSVDPDAAARAAAQAAASLPARPAPRPRAVSPGSRPATPRPWPCAGAGGQPRVRDERPPVGQRADDGPRPEEDHGCRIRLAEDAVPVEVHRAEEGPVRLVRGRPRGDGVTAAGVKIIARLDFQPDWSRQDKVFNGPPDNYQTSATS